MFPFKEQLKSIVASWYGAPAAELVVGFTPLPSLIVLVAGMFWLQPHKTPELNCPACKKLIVGMRHLVVATKCCPSCGKKILNDVE